MSIVALSKRIVASVSTNDIRLRCNIGERLIPIKNISSTPSRDDSILFSVPRSEVPISLSLRTCERSPAGGADSCIVAIGTDKCIYCLDVTIQSDHTTGVNTLILEKSMHLAVLGVQSLEVLDDAIICATRETLIICDVELRCIETVAHATANCIFLREFCLFGISVLVWIGDDGSLTVWERVDCHTSRIFDTKVDNTVVDCHVCGDISRGKHAGYNVVVVTADGVLHIWRLGDGHSSERVDIDVPQLAGLHPNLGIFTIDGLIFVLSASLWCCVMPTSSVSRSGPLQGLLDRGSWSSDGRKLHNSPLFFSKLWAFENEDILALQASFDDSLVFLRISDLLKEYAAGVDEAGVSIAGGISTIATAVFSIAKHAGIHDHTIADSAHSDAEDTESKLYEDDPDAAGPTPLPANEEDDGAALWLIRLLTTKEPAEGSVLCSTDVLTAASKDLGPASRETGMLAAKESSKSTDGGRKHAPVTFHARIKSSGYGAAPPRKPSFAAKRPVSRTGSAPSHLVDKVALYTAIPGVFEDSPAPPVKHASGRSILPIASVVQLQLSSDGRTMAAGGADGALCTMRLAATADALDGVASSVVQHITSKSMNRCLDWSHTLHEGFITTLQQSSMPGKRGPPVGVQAGQSSRFLLACNGEKHVSLYASGVSEPLLRLSDAEGAATTGAEPGAAKMPFPGSVTAACFLYHDKFISVASSNTAYLFRYHIEPPHTGDGPADDVVRLRKKLLKEARYKRCSWWQAAPEGYSVQALCTHNAQRSPILCVAASDKSVRLFDLGDGPEVSEKLVLEAVHERAVHTMVLPSPVEGWATSEATMNAIVTASTDGTVKLWDLRAAVCAVTLSGGHVNRVHSCGVALHPNMMQLAVGSEDRTAVLYDLRTAGVVAKCRGATDAVTSVAFHPTAPVLIAGSLDGVIRAHRMDYGSSDTTE